MKTFNYKNALGLLLIAAALSTACDNEYGLFASIQEEVEQTSSKIFTDAVVRDVVAFSGKFYAVTGGIYARPVSGGDWSKVSGGNFGRSDYFCTGIALGDTGTTLYAAVRSNSSSSSGIGIFKTTDGNSWSTALPTSMDIQALYSVFDSTNYQVFAVVRDAADAYDLHYFNGSAFTGEAISNATDMIVEGAYADSEYWFASGTAVYHGPTGALSSDLSLDATPPSGKTINGITATTDGTMLYLSTADRLVYRRASAANAWTNLTVSSDSDDYLAGLLVLPSGQIAVGLEQADTTANTGYYEIASGFGSAVLGDAGVLATATNYDTSLSDKSVHKFYSFDDGTNVTLFACTASGGTGESALWSNKYTTSWNGWTAE